MWTMPAPPLIKPRGICYPYVTKDAAMAELVDAPA